MAAPLLERLRELRDEGPLRMHMPGHKGRLTIPELEGLAGLDFTELPPTGDLFAGEGPALVGGGGRPRPGNPQPGGECAEKPPGNQNGLYYLSQLLRCVV